MASDRRSPAHQLRRASRLRWSWSHDDLAENGAIFQQSDGLVGVFQGHLPVDDRRELAGAEEIQQRRQIFSHPAIGASDVELEGPDEAQILLGVVPGGCAAGQDPSLPVQRLERGYPGVATGEVDNDVNTVMK